MRLKIILPLALMTTGCVTTVQPCSSLVDVGASASVKALQCVAAAGDPRASLELGERYERGDGVAMDLSKAERLYLLAAKGNSGMSSLYVPSSTDGRYGTVITTRTGPERTGLPEAWSALAQLRLRTARSARDRYVACRTARAAEPKIRNELLESDAGGRKLGEYC